MKKKIVALSVLCVAVIFVGAVFLLPLFSVDGKVEGSGGLDPELVPGAYVEPREAEPVELTILCTGDVMAHKTQLDAQKQADGTYDFTDNFQYIKPYVEVADVAICNLETTFGQAPYTGYPAFLSV